MATGDLVKLGTLYVGGVGQKRPSRPWATNTRPTESGLYGDINNYPRGASFSIENTSTEQDKQIWWREIIDDGKKFLVCDRNILSRVSWNDLNSRELIMGKSIEIDGSPFIIRVMSGGRDYRNPSKPDNLAGGSLPNEWDRWIANEGEFSGLPTPKTTDLDSSLDNHLFGEHNLFWNWSHQSSITQEAYTKDFNYHSIRGFFSARNWANAQKEGFDNSRGWRPVLEVLETSPTPNSKIVIGGQQRKITDMHVVIGGQQRKVVEGYTIIGGVPKKWV